MCRDEGLHIQKHNQNILGVLDQGSRICLFLNSLPNKSTIQIIKALIFCFEKYGFPQAIRTDNEAVFCSYKMKLF
jgi:putative transposase